MRFKTLLLIAASAVIVSAPMALATDGGNSDVLRLSDAALVDGVWSVEVHVINDQELAGLDIPVQFGAENDGIELIRVEFAPRVENWDFTHARIDNQEKTVILGLISELMGTRTNADLKVSAQGETRVATLVFKVEDGVTPEFSTFTTKGPSHELTFLYNKIIDGKPEVQSYAPKFELDLDFKASVLPASYALSQNFPNPFNPSTNFTLSLPEASDYSIRIINITGQLVKTFEGRLEAGVHTITWDGSNNQSSKVASGLYFYQAQAGDFRETRKMVMLK